MGKVKINYHIKNKIKIPNPSQEPQASSKAPNQDVKDKDVLCIFKIKLNSQNSEHQYGKDQLQYPNQDQGAQTQLGISSILQKSKSGL